MNQEAKFTVEDVDQVAAPPRATVEETATDKLERKRDYLEGFLAAKPEDIAPGAPGGAYGLPGRP